MERLLEIDFLDKKLLKSLIHNHGVKESMQQSFQQLQTIAKELRDSNLTMKISYQGDTVLLLGEEAKPSFSKIVTGTNTIEFINIPRLLQLLS